MYRKFCYTIILIFSLFNLNTANANSDFAKLPMQFDGRVIPFDSYARTSLTFLSTKTKLSDLSAIEWFEELILDPRSAYQRPCFKILNPDLITLLELPTTAKSLYTFIEITNALNAKSELIAEVQNTEISKLATIQEQLLDLHFKHLWFYRISQTLTIFLPEFLINDQDLANELGLNQQISYLELHNKSEQIAVKIEQLINKSKLTDKDKELLTLVQSMQSFAASSNIDNIKIIPVNSDNWQSPWQYFTASDFNSNNKIFNNWHEIAKSYRLVDKAKFHSDLQLLQKNLADIIKPKTFKLLNLEFLYNQYNPLGLALFCYFISLALIFLGRLIWQNHKSSFYRSAFYVLNFGIFLHFIAIIARVVIMERPPVSTLYESIIFVAFINAILAILLQLKQRDITISVTSNIIAISLLFVAEKFNVNKDSFAVLAAVLDSNFWLGTHVLTISIGYACCLLSGCLAHIYLLMANFSKIKIDELKRLLNNIFIISLIALFFSVTGTILGGIWADQSWGRFWGWDPKENGALLICLWLIYILHCKIAKMYSDFTYAVGLAITNIIVVLAWYGVNLLNIGLHSYGFTDNIATNLFLFCSAEIAFLTMMCYFRKQKTLIQEKQTRN
jgi:ABC-type transport system involved in cytochrome c biogenesis permease subunit